MLWRAVSNLASSCCISFFCKREISAERTTYLSGLKLLALVVGTFLSQLLHALGLFNFKLLQLAAVVHRFFDPLVDCNQLLVVLHFLKAGSRLDLGSLHCAAQLGVELLHLVFVVILQQLDLLERLVFKLGEFLFPGSVEVSEQVVADAHVLAHLRLLNVRPQLALVLHYKLFKKADLPHEVLVELVLVDFAALIGEQLHFGLDHGKNQNLLVFVQLTVTPYVEHFNQFLGGRQA